MDYNVQNLQDDIYQVYSYPDDEESDEWSVEYQGSLSDCEAYIRLKEQGYM